jgi:hypothetical protein
MNKIINYLLRKAWQIFVPIFFLVLGFFIGAAPFITGLVLNNLWWFLGFILSIPAAVAIIAITNSVTDWEDVWDFEDLDDIRNDSTGIL